MTETHEREWLEVIEHQIEQAKSREGAKNALALLFPKVEKSLQTYVPTDRDNAGRRYLKRRLSEKNAAENYFRLSPMPTSWGISEFEEMIRQGPEFAFDVLKRKLEILPARSRARQRAAFIELLDAAFSSQHEINKIWLAKILEESKEFIQEKDEAPVGFLSVDNEDRLQWMITNALARLDEERRADLMIDAIASARDLTLLSDVIRTICGDTHKDGGKERNTRSTFGNKDETIRESLVKRIRVLADSNHFWHQARPEKLLWFWWGADKELEVRSFIDRAIHTPDGLSALLNITVGTVVSSSGNYERVGNYWSRIVDLEMLASLANKLLITGQKDQRDRAQRFLKALEISRKSSF